MKESEMEKEIVGFSLSKMGWLDWLEVCLIVAMVVLMILCVALQMSTLTGVVEESSWWLKVQMGLYYGLFASITINAIALPILARKRRRS